MICADIIMEILSFKRCDSLDDYEVYKSLPNSLNNFSWFMKKLKYGTDFYVKTSNNIWYTQSTMEDWIMMYPCNLSNNVVMEYNQLIKKETETKNFIYGCYLLQEIMGFDVISYMKSII